MYMKILSIIFYTNTIGACGILIFKQQKGTQII